MCSYTPNTLLTLNAHFYEPYISLLAEFAHSKCYAALKTSEINLFEREQIDPILRHYEQIK